MSLSAAENGSSELILSAKNDAHGGVIVEMKDPMDSQAFVTLLRASLLKWKQQVITFAAFLLLKSVI